MREITKAVALAGVPAFVVSSRYQTLTPGRCGEPVEPVGRLVARVRIEAGSE